MLLLCPQPEEDIVLHTVSQLLESRQVAKPHFIEASQGDPEQRGSFRTSKARSAALVCGATYLLCRLMRPFLRTH